VLVDLTSHLLFALQYVRLSHDTDVQLILKLMLDRWNLEIPNLVISVTGGAKSFVLKPRLKEVFRRGLIKAAKSTNAWIITGLHYHVYTLINIVVFSVACGKFEGLIKSPHIAKQSFFGNIATNYTKIAVSQVFKMFLITRPLHARRNKRWCDETRGRSSEGTSNHVWQ